MKFKLDENLPAELLDVLQAQGHEADTVVDEYLSGEADRIILAAVRSEERVLLTLDKGIGDIRQFPPEAYFGIVLFRPSDTGRGAVFDFVRERLPKVLEIDLRGRLLVVSKNSFRLR